MFSGLYLTRIELRQPVDAELAQSYVFSLPAVKHLGRLELRQPVTFLVGENGTGKSTLLEAIAVACGFNPEGGTRNFSFSTSDTHSPLHRALIVSKGVKRPKDGFFLRAESFYNVATEVDRLDKITPVPLLKSYGGRSLHCQSHGESFLALMLHRFGGQGLYLLDEPEAALSPSSLFAMLIRMRDLVEQDSQFLIATHSPILMAYPGAEIYQLDEVGIRLTSYGETSHYLLTRQFLNYPQKMLEDLFRED